MKKFVWVLLICVLLSSALLALVSCGDAKQVASANANTYTIVAGYDPTSHVVTATQTVNVTNRSDNCFEAVKFHIYANQYREDAQNNVVPNTYRLQAYPNGDSFGDITFDSVLVNDNAVAYVIEGQDMDILSVPMADQGLFLNQSVNITMTYTITLANIHHRLGYNQSTVNLGNFYPVLCSVKDGNYNCSPYYCIGDPFVTDVANYNVSITLPTNYIVATSGIETQCTPAENDCTTHTYQATATRDFAMVASDRYQTSSGKVGEITVNYLYYNDEQPATALATAMGMVEMLNKKVGEYPFEQINVCQTEFCYGGMEYPNLALVASNTKNYLQAVAHEVAHQWFYGVVGNDQIEHAWMDEGLAEFVTALFFDKQQTSTLQQFVKANTKTYTTYVDVLSHYYTNVDRSMRAIPNYKNDSEYVIFSYVKGSLLFATLHETMGETKFFKALANYYKTCAFSVAHPDQLKDCFVKAGNAELGNIVDSFVNGTEIIGTITD